MSLKSRIKDLANVHSISIAELERKLNFANGSITKWDKQSPSSERLQAVADYFDVSVDYLLGRTNKEHYYDLTDKEKKDIGVQAEKLMQGIESGHDLNFYGEPATEEQKSRLLIAVQTAMEMNKKEAKKKFTPKKYRE